MTKSTVYCPPSGPGATKNDDIHAIEDAVISSIDNSGQTKVYPCRPSYGSDGNENETLLWTNSVQLSLEKDRTFYWYEISIKENRVVTEEDKAKNGKTEDTTTERAVPKVVGKKRVQIMRLFLRYGSLSNKVVTDFKSTLISQKRLAQNECFQKVTYRLEGEKTPRPSAKVYEVRLEYKKELPVSDLHTYLASSNSSARYAAKDDMIKAVNIFFNHYAESTKGIIRVGQGKTFGTDAGQRLGGGLEVATGFYSSARLATSRLLVNINISHSVFYMDGLATNLAEDRGMNPQRLASLLKRLRVDTSHIQQQHSRTIHGLATQEDGKNLRKPPIVAEFGANADGVQFWWTTKKRYISVNKFFKEKHNKSLEFPFLPVVNVGNSENPVYLPLEVCIVSYGQIARVKLNPHQADRMIGYAIRSGGPARDAEKIVEKGVDLVGLWNGNKSLSEFGISVTPELITVPARILKTPTVTYRTKAAEVTGGSWSLKGMKFKKGGALGMRKWAYAVISMPNATNTFSDAESSQSENLRRVFQARFRDLGITCPEPAKLQCPFEIDPQNKMEEDIEKIFDAAQKQSITLLLIILPKRVQAPIYNCIKRLGDIRKGIATICTDGEKLGQNPNHIGKIAMNIAMKLNLKLGGDNQGCQLSGAAGINFNETMIVGIDVTHPSPSSSDEAPSIAGMVASVDSSLGQWPAVLRRQGEARQEMVSELEEMLDSRLGLWKEHNKRYPNDILVYRDGVSEGQYQEVLDKELLLLRSACKKLYPASDYKKGLPRFTIVIVAKRHHIRFYPTKEEDSDTSHHYNPLPGTIVDRGITEARNWDFFLQPHVALQGTARPIHYFVLLDEIFRSKSQHEAADQLEAVTHALCYTYGRSTTAVSVCTPAYYADLVCDRARCYLSHLFDADGQASPNNAAEEIRVHSNLENSMFYI
ncbi:Piwi-domain-containing protein [Hypomontagnella monticulosa]|nr:Piwi-domain-containing protein [Hypomontagnella monticulosa]